MNNIAILTFHAAYNFGSVLQAFATQVAIDRVSNTQSVIINYRFPEQKRIYALYQHNGIKSELKNVLQVPLHAKRKIRQNKFEYFINTYMRTTEEINDPLKVYSLFSKYKTLVCGSDQIWNKHANELQNIDWKYMLPYLGYHFEGKLISYASSISNMRNDELEYIKPFLLQFDSISAREKSGGERISNLLKKEVVNVIDPTFLLSENEWIRELNLLKKDGERYILYYTLHGYGDFANVKDKLINVAKESGKKIKIIAPFYIMQVNSKYYEFDTDSGPIEFVEAIYNADCVITDSFHGTAFALNFHKPFISIIEEGKAEFRKSELLNSFGVESLGVKLKDLEEKVWGNAKIDYDSKLESIRKQSISYLERSLNTL